MGDLLRAVLGAFVVVAMKKLNDLLIEWIIRTDMLPLFIITQLVFACLMVLTEILAIWLKIWFVL